jgi:hypothetical protein
MLRDATFELVDADLLAIDTKVKHMNIVGFTTAVVLRLEAERQASAPEFARLFKMAEQTFKATLASVPDDANTWLEWSVVLCLLAAGMFLRNNFVVIGVNCCMNERDVVDRWMLSSRRLQSLSAHESSAEQLPTQHCWQTLVVARLIMP